MFIYVGDGHVVPSGLGKWRGPIPVAEATGYTTFPLRGTEYGSTLTFLSQIFFGSGLSGLGAFLTQRPLRGGFIIPPAMLMVADSMFEGEFHTDHTGLFAAHSH